jgi:hypothetical protein
LPRHGGGGPGRLAAMAGEALQGAGTGQQIEFALAEFGAVRQIRQIGEWRLCPRGNDAPGGRGGKTLDLLQAEAQHG